MNKQLAHLVGPGVDLSGVDFTGADLTLASLTGADLTGADLTGADLTDAYLVGACLAGVNLHRADLHHADLAGADLTGANLAGANLTDANLAGANLTDANLTGTCLDPQNIPNSDVAAFERDGNYLIGYRTARKPHMGGPDYVPGKTYTAPVLSTSDTECHPGIYLCPSMGLGYPGRYVKVRALAAGVHRAGTKWRAKSIEVIEYMP